MVTAPDAGRRRAVVLDIGGVLIDWNPHHLYRALFAEEAAMESFLAEVCTDAWNACQDAGRPFAEAVAELTARHPAELHGLMETYDARRGSRHQPLQRSSHFPFPAILGFTPADRDLPSDPRPGRHKRSCRDAGLSARWNNIPALGPRRRPQFPGAWTTRMPSTDSSAAMMFLSS